MFFNRSVRRAIHASNATPPPRPYPGYTTQKLVWGAPIWVFMHTLVAKIKPECYLEIRDTLWVLINRICQNLPCPECSAHAVEYMRLLDKTQFSTLHDLEWMLFTFHNTVNARKLVPAFSWDILHTTYSEKKWQDVFPPFIKIMQNSYGSMLNMMSNDSRKMLSRQIIDWFTSHRYCFYD